MRLIVKKGILFLILFMITCVHILMPGNLPGADILHQKWLRRVTPHFILHYIQPDHRLADEIMKYAEEDYKRIVKDIGIDPGITAEVFLAPDRKSYKALQPMGQNTHEWSIGVFYPHQNLILLLSPKAIKASHPDIRQIMAHELTHFILHALTREKGTELPMWLHEGLAMYEAQQWNWHHRLIMAEIALTRSFLPLSSISRGFPADKRLADRAYAQSISLIAYIINKYSIDDLHRMIRHLVEGQSPPEAFYRIFGISLIEFERNWHIYLRRRYNWIPFLTSSFAIWFFISLLSLFIYRYKKRRSQKKMALWDIEEQIDSFLH